MPIQDFGTGEGPSPLSRDPNTPQGTVGDRNGHGTCGVSGCEKSDSAQCRSRKPIPWKMKQGGNREEILVVETTKFIGNDCPGSSPGPV